MNRQEPRKRKTLALHRDGRPPAHAAADAKGPQAGGHGVEGHCPPQGPVEGFEYWRLGEHASHNVHQSG